MTKTLLDDKFYQAARANLMRKLDGDYDPVLRLNVVELLEAMEADIIQARRDADPRYEEALTIEHETVYVNWEGKAVKPAPNHPVMGYVDENGRFWEVDQSGNALVRLADGVTWDEAMSGFAPVQAYVVSQDEERAERRQRLRREADEWLARKLESEALDSEG